MLTVIMECQNQEQQIAQSLSSLVSGAVQGLVADVILLDRGSNDGTAQLADAVGCRHVENVNLSDILASARGEWILVIEPGSRVMPSSWNEEIPDYIGLNLGPASFRRSPHYQMSFFKRVFGRKNPLECGLMMSKEQLLRASATGMTLRDIALRTRTRKLMAQIVPAWALASSASRSAAH